jgi:hypothetical protein
VSKKLDDDEKLANAVTSRGALSANVPLIARLAHDIPKPKDWQAFQRACVILFREELRDPNAQESGRSGQVQGGIDVSASYGPTHQHQHFGSHAPATCYDN